MRPIFFAQFSALDNSENRYNLAHETCEPASMKWVKT